MRDLTQADLALEVGVSRKSINAIERGRFVPSTELGPEGLKERPGPLLRTRQLLEETS